VVAHPGGALALGRVGALVEAIGHLMADGRQVLLVSSGAVGLGARRLGYTQRPVDVVDRQACAAAGQGELMGFYDRLFSTLGRVAAQVLVTETDFKDRRRYLNTHATLTRLLERGAIPVLNENDTVSTAEVALHGAKVFGDNDALSALIAMGVQADALLLLSDVDGVYTAPPSEPGSQRIQQWDAQDIAVGALSAGGRGGMGAKIRAARRAAQAGTPTIIASGHTADTLVRVFDGQDVGTYFPASKAWNGRRRWLAFAAEPAGAVQVQQGAVQALVDGGASLLPVGITRVLGSFAKGDVVSILDPSGLEFARGVSQLTAAELSEQQGQSGHRAAVHRDRVVIFGDGWTASSDP